MDGYYSFQREGTDDLMELSPKAVKLYLYLTYRAAYRDGIFCKVGEVMDSLKGLSERTKLSVQNVRTSLQVLIRSGFIRKNQHGNQHNLQLVRYTNPAFANTLSNNQLTRDQHATNTQLTPLEEVRSKEVKKEIEETTTFKSGKPEFEQVLALEFQKLWERYPKRRGRKAALRHFQASVKTPDDLAAIHGALSAYLADLKFNATSSQYTQNGSTWFNDWTSWIEVTKVRHVAPKPVIKPPEELYEPTEEDLREMHLITIKAVGRCLHDECRFCSKVRVEVSA